MDVAVELLVYLIFGWFFGAWVGPYLNIASPYDALLGGLLGFTLAMLTLYKRALLRAKPLSKHTDSKQPAPETDMTPHDDAL
jgi:F0F1-type ATP synthase assembly protein I